MNIDAKARAIVDRLLDGTDGHEVEDVTAFLLSVRNEALEEAARTADGCFMGRAGAAIRALKEGT